MCEESVTEYVFIFYLFPYTRFNLYKLPYIFMIVLGMALPVVITTITTDQHVFVSHLNVIK